MATGAYAFSPRVSRVFRDRRMAVHFEDAKSFFARHGKRYDVIVSEPSNPWVNGVASLFTAEFYRHAARHLAPDGVFVQWLQIYEMNDRLLGSMFAALDPAFADYDVYQSSVGDLIVMAVRQGRVPLPGELPAGEPAFADMLKQVGITRREHVLVRRVGGKRELAPFIAQLAPPVNSDFRPLVQLEAPRARYLRQTADGMVLLAIAPLPILEMLGDERRTFLPELAPRAGMGLYTQQVSALELHQALVAGKLVQENQLPPASVLVLRAPRALCGAQVEGYVLEQLHVAAINTLPHLAPRYRRELWVEPKWIGCPLARTAPQVQQRFAVYRAIAERDARAMLGQARVQLEADKRESVDWARYLLLTAVLGAQASGQGAEAQRLWSKFSPGLHGDDLAPFERYLLAFRP
jgi:hypothetical protein